MSPPPATRTNLLSWANVTPVVALIVLVMAWGRILPPLIVVVITALLAGAVLAAVHHAEVVAHRVGEPFGSLVLAVAVTVIEVALIVTLMVSAGDRRDAGRAEPGTAHVHHEPPGSGVLARTVDLRRRRLVVVVRGVRGDA